MTDVPKPPREWRMLGYFSRVSGQMIAGPWYSETIALEAFQPSPHHELRSVIVREARDDE